MGGFDSKEAMGGFDAVHRKVRAVHGAGAGVPIILHYPKNSATM